MDRNTLFIVILWILEVHGNQKISEYPVDYITDYNLQQVISNL